MIAQNIQKFQSEELCSDEKQRMKNLMDDIKPMIREYDEIEIGSISRKKPLFGFYAQSRL